MAAAARGALRVSDVLGRLGGEEFAMLLPDTDLPARWSWQSGVRAAVAATEVQSGEVRASEAPRSVRVTISVGVAERRGDESIETLLKRADRALYAAKDLGRDRVKA